MATNVLYTSHSFSIDKIQNKYPLNSNRIINTTLGVLFLGVTALSPVPTEQNIIIEKSFPSAYEYSVPCPTLNPTTEVHDVLKFSNLNKIKLMSLFQDDWNGNGAKAFSTEAISLFSSIIERLKHQPQIAPTGRNSLYIQYKLDDNCFLSFEIQETKIEKLLIPRGDLNRARTEIFEKDLVDSICKKVEMFYE